MWKSGQKQEEDVRNRNARENVIWWKPRSGTSYSWFDNWLQLGPLHLQAYEGILINETTEDVTEVIQGEPLG